MNKCHANLNFTNDTTPAINATNLNYMDGCIDTLDNRVVELDANKANASDLVITNPNLIMNPWFTINQRGNTQYVSSGLSWDMYTFDRWRMVTGQSVGTCVVEKNTIDGGIDISGTFVLAQPLTQEVIDGTQGKRVTLSVIVEGQLISNSGVVDWTQSGNQIVMQGGDPLYIISLWGKGNAVEGQCWVIIIIGTPSATVSYVNANVKAIKLELGARSTLNLDTAPNYADELLKCQRYFLYRTDTRIPLVAEDRTRAVGVYQFPVPMRTVPTVRVQSTAYDIIYSGDTTSHVYVDEVNDEEVTKESFIYSAEVTQSTGGFTVGYTYHGFAAFEFDAEFYDALS